MARKDKKIDEDLVRRLELKEKAETRDRERIEKWKVGNKNFS